MFNRQFVRKIIAFIVGWSTSFTVANALRNNVHPDTKPRKAMLWIGSVACGAVAAKHAEAHVKKSFDEIADEYDTAKSARS